MSNRESVQQELDAKRKDYLDVFSTGAGKRVLDDLEKFCGFKNTSVYEQDPNELQTFYAEGKRRVYLRILSFMEK